MAERPHEPQGMPATPRVEQLARSLREQPMMLDEVTRARMERSLVQAWRTRAAAAVPLPRTTRRFAPVRRGAFAGSLAIAAAAGALIAYYGAGFGGSSTVPAGMARFELRVGSASLQRGTIAEGQMLESGELGDIDVDLGSAHLEMARQTRVRFDRLSSSELRMTLSSGRVEVDFHPARKGEQRMTIDSRSAQVRVIGTRFSVEADATGNTEVFVREGVVEVAPTAGGAAQRVAAGERAYVRVDEGDATERAVRASIEEMLPPSAPESPTIEIELAAAEAAIAEASEAAARQRRQEAEDAADGAEDTRMSDETLSRRLQAARDLLRQGRHSAARTRLRELAERDVALRFRVEALTLLAESYTSQADLEHATEAYERAAELGARTPEGANAQFALARLLERYTRDSTAAVRAYGVYLKRAPKGALAAQARAALCRLGQASHCD